MSLAIRTSTKTARLAICIAVAATLAACAKHHMAAAHADDEGNEEAAAKHAHLAYRHQLNAVQYAEIAAMESESLDDEFDIPAEVEHE